MTIHTVTRFLSAGTEQACRLRFKMDSRVRGNDGILFRGNDGILFRWNPFRANHTLVQITRQYKSHVSTNHTSVQITRQHKSHVSTNHTSVQITRQYKSHVSTNHTLVQITRQYKSHVSTNHTLVHISRQYKSHVSTHLTSFPRTRESIYFFNRNRINTGLMDITPGWFRRQERVYLLNTKPNMIN
jgi:membrane-bound lytic murein transglycosylase